jgi:hypothetical protein
MSLEELIRRIPKAELHIHIEGSLEPELMFDIARRNSVALRFRSVDELRRAYAFTDLQSFLDIYYEGACVLRADQSIRNLIIGNVGTLIAFRVGTLDTTLLAREFSPELSRDDLLGFPNRHFDIRMLAKGEAVRPFTARTIDIPAAPD